MLAVLDAWQLHPAVGAANGENMSRLKSIPAPPPAPKPFVRHLTIIAHNAEPSLKLSPPGAKAEPWDVGVTIIADVNQARNEVSYGAVTVWYLDGEWGTFDSPVAIWCDRSFDALAESLELPDLISAIEYAACESAREKRHATRTLQIPGKQ